MATLKEEIARLENLCSDELVIVEKVEFKEVYGKKKQVEALKAR